MKVFIFPGHREINTSIWTLKIITGPSILCRRDRTPGWLWGTKVGQHSPPLLGLDNKDGPHTLYILWLRFQVPQMHLKSEIQGQYFPSEERKEGCCGVDRGLGVGWGMRSCLPAHYPPFPDLKMGIWITLLLCCYLFIGSEVSLIDIDYFCTISKKKKSPNG